MVYVTSDLHGYSLEKFLAFLEKSGFTEKDFLCVLGDVIDRGEDGIKILKWLMVQPNAELILGNHEAMMLSCDFLFETITEESINALTGANLRLYSNWYSNGGRPTINALSATEKEERAYILEYLKEAPLYAEFTLNGRKFLLVHSGLDNFQSDKAIEDYSAHDLLWCRPSLDTRYYEDVITIFGHTPTLFYGSEYTGKAVITDTWIDIDTGAAVGLKPMLLRLDDMKEFYME